MINRTANTSNIMTNTSSDNLNTRKWGTTIEEGFVLIPSLLLRYQKQLKLDNTELVVLLNLLSCWWDIPSLPHIQTSTLANRIGVSRRTAQRAVNSLEKKGFVKRIWGSNKDINSRAGATYDLRGTVNILGDSNNFIAPAKPRVRYKLNNVEELL